MTPAQATAHGAPCFDALECADPRFTRRLPPPNDDTTIVLTCNVGLE
ncbi:MAG: hypothetical protein MI806_25900 [Minwuiales bacterium]|nr:hypothetical protein [Minwuiales bacterium]